MIYLYKSFPNQIFNYPIESEDNMNGTAVLIDISPPKGVALHAEVYKRNARNSVYHKTVPTQESQRRI